VAAAAAPTSSVDPNGTTGATLRYIDGTVMVTQVPPHSAAAKAGVRTGWILDAVNGCPLSTRLSRIPKDMDPRRAALTAFSVANQMLAGPAESSVQATFRDATDEPRRLDRSRT
jgi:predicted metalloprotease with PDZ domain